MDSKPRRDTKHHKTGKRCLRPTRLSGGVNFQLCDSAFQRTWSYNHVLEHGPLEAIQDLKRTHASVSYLDRIHEVWLALMSKLVMANSREKVKRVTFVGRYLQQQNWGKELTELAQMHHLVPHGDRERDFLLAGHGFINLVTRGSSCHVFYE